MREKRFQRKMCPLRVCDDRTKKHDLWLATARRIGVERQRRMKERERGERRAEKRREVERKEERRLKVRDDDRDSGEETEGNNNRDEIERRDSRLRGLN